MATKTERPAEPRKLRVSTGPSVAVRPSKNPAQMTEDEEDLLVARQRIKQPTIGFGEYLAKHGYELDPQGRPRRAKGT